MLCINQFTKQLLKDQQKLPVKWLVGLPDFRYVPNSLRDGNGNYVPAIRYTVPSDILIPIVNRSTGEIYKDSNFEHSAWGMLILSGSPMSTTQINVYIFLGTGTGSNGGTKFTITQQEYDKLSAGESVIKTIASQTVDLKDAAFLIYKNRTDVLGVEFAEYGPSVEKVNS